MTNTARTRSHPRNNTLHTIGTVVAAATMATLVTMSVQNVAAYAEHQNSQYQACEYEDSNDCVWDAKHMGNGTGRSYYATPKGKVIYLPHHIAHYLINN